MSDHVIQILHLYPDLLNLYGDKGNIQSMKKRLNWRGIDAVVMECTAKNNTADIANADIIFIGGGGDREQAIVCGLLAPHKQALQSYVEQNGVLLATCGGYELLGKQYVGATTTMDALDILDIKTKIGRARLTGNVILDSDLFDQKIVGFEHHIGTVDIGNYTPLGKVAAGSDHFDGQRYEGVVYKNVIATHLHGPLLPKNPMLCDELLRRGIQRKYPDFEGLAPLNDELEHAANQAAQTLLPAD